MANHASQDDWEHDFEARRAQRQEEWDREWEIKQAKLRRAIRISRETASREYMLIAALGAGVTGVILLASALAHGTNFAPIALALASLLALAAGWVFRMLWDARHGPLVSTSYDGGQDVLSIRVAPGSTAIAKTDVVAPGVIMDTDASGDLVGFEVTRFKARRAS